MKLICLSFIGRWVFQLLFFLNKVKIHGEENLLNLAKAGKPVMVCVWHGRLLFPSWYIRLKTTNLHAIASHQVCYTVTYDLICRKVPWLNTVDHA